MIISGADVVEDIMRHFLAFIAALTSLKVMSCFFSIAEIVEGSLVGPCERRRYANTRMLNFKTSSTYFLIKSSR